MLLKYFFKQLKTWIAFLEFCILTYIRNIYNVLSHSEKKFKLVKYLLIQALSFKGNNSFIIVLEYFCFHFGIKYVSITQIRDHIIFLIHQFPL